MEPALAALSCSKAFKASMAAAVLSYPSGEFAVMVSEYDHAAGELDHKAALNMLA